MRRLGLFGFVSVLALASANSSLAADLDYPTDMRGTYNDWDAPDDPLMKFETGIRYIYSIGGQNLGVAGQNFGAEHTGHIAEAYLRLDDLSTNTYLKGTAGYAGFISGTGTNTVNGLSGPITGGRMASAVIDLGYHPLHWQDGDNSGGLGGFIGYQYLNDSPNLGRGNYAVIDSASDVSWNQTNGNPIFGWNSAPNNLNINALRMGVSGDVEFGALNLSGELAAIPYAMISGTAPAALNSVGVQSSPTTYQGSAFGASGELMVGTSIENWNFKVGGRAMYLAGNGSAHYEVATFTNGLDGDVPPDGIYETPGTVSLQNVRRDLDAFSMWRYGILAQISVDF